MASIINDPHGRRRIAFISPDGSRKAIRLGKIDLKAAQSIRTHMEALLASKVAGQPIRQETAVWLGNVGEKLKEKLASVGLIAAEKKPEKKPEKKATLGGFLDEFVLSRKDVKPATITAWGQACKSLKDFFGASRLLADITPGDCDSFKQWISTRGYSPATVAKRIAFAKGFLHSAWRHRIIPENPFEDVRVPSYDASLRQSFVDRETIDRVMGMANPTWRIIVALCRYGGLRCPSEVLSLELAHIDWEKGVIRAPSPKTEKYLGKDFRVIPIHKALRRYLLEAAELAKEGQIHVVPGDLLSRAQGPRGWQNCNLRTGFEKLLKRAGIKPWPRLFHNLRSSCETELLADHPLHTVAKWMGHDAEIATRHYAQVLDADIEKAIGETGGVKNGALVAQNAAKKVDAGSSRDLRPLDANPLELATCAASCDTIPDIEDIKEWRRGESNLCEIPGETDVFGEGGAECGADTYSSQISNSPDLARIVEAWDSLPPGIRAAINALLDSCLPGNR